MGLHLFSNSKKTNRFSQWDWSEKPKPNLCRTWGGSVGEFGWSTLKKPKKFPKPNFRTGAELTSVDFLIPTQIL
jgi:hypothetical protein